MPLDNTAKLSDIIEKLRDIEGINSRADLISVVGTPAVEGNTIADINSVIQESKNIIVDKLGDGSSSTEPLLQLVNKLGNLTYAASGTVYTNPVTNIAITGLNFVPSFIIGALATTNTTGSYFMLFVDGSGTSITKNLGVTHQSTVTTNTVDGITTVNFTSTSQAIYTSSTFQWVAIK